MVKIVSVYSGTEPDSKRDFAYYSTFGGNSRHPTVPVPTMILVSRSWDTIICYNIA